jgi:hypothetical protein
MLPGRCSAPALSTARKAHSALAAAMAWCWEAAAGGARLGLQRLQLVLLRPDRGLQLRRLCLQRGRACGYQAPARHYPGA